jgi:hypothetical protein
MNLDEIVMKIFNISFPQHSSKVLKYLSLQRIKGEREEDRKREKKKEREERPERVGRSEYEGSVEN